MVDLAPWHPLNDPTLDINQQWTPELAQEQGMFGIPLGAPGLSADQMFQIAQAAESGGLMAPGENMTAETYGMYMDMNQQAQQNALQGRMLNSTNSAINALTGAVQGSPLVGQMEQALQPQDLNSENFEARRRIYDANFNPNAGSAAVGAANMAGSTSSQIAGNMANQRRAGDLANLAVTGQQADQQNALARASGLGDLLGLTTQPLSQAAQLQAQLTGMLGSNAPVQFTTSFGGN